MRQKSKHTSKYTDRDSRERKGSTGRGEWRPSKRVRFVPADTSENWVSSRGLIFARPFAEV